MPNGKTALWIVATVPVVLAFILRAAVPQNWLVPGGWPLRKNWYHMDQAAFWLFLAAGIVTVVVALVRAIVSGSNGR